MESVLWVNRYNKVVPTEIHGKIKRHWEEFWEMSKFDLSYRRKRGNCNKPFRRCPGPFEAVDWYDDETQASCSYDRSPNRWDSQKGNAECSWRSRQPPGSCRTVGRERGSRSEKHSDSKNLEGRFRRSEPSEVRDGRKPDTVGSGGKMKHPPHLKGKEIGLWYAQFSKKKKLNQESKKRSYLAELALNHRTMDYLEEVLSTVGVSESEMDEEINHSRKRFAAMCLQTFEDKINSAEVFHNTDDPEMNIKLYEELLNKNNSLHYRQMCRVREKLPTFKMKNKILATIEKNQICVISGGTGCGKTTQIVQYVLDDYILKKKGSMCNIICTQPRRISAVTVSERISCERDEKPGESIGYHIRLECARSARTQCSINFLTTGILLTMLSSEPILNGVTHLFLDEIHERNIESDMMLALLKYIIPKRPDLKIILMSATVNSDSFSEYFGGVPQIEIPGKTYPVEELFLEDILTRLKFRYKAMKKVLPDQTFYDYVLPYVNDLELRGAYPRFVTEALKNPLSEDINFDLLVELIHDINNHEEEGAILVFVPGLSDISFLKKQFINSPGYVASKFILVPMHSRLSSLHQKKAFDYPPRGVRKIIIATSILETSVTVEDVVYVIDTGKNKISGYDLKLRIATLKPSWISVANACQRRGRAGRVRPGKCFKLYTRVRQEIFNKFPVPEMLTTSLEEVILKAKSLGLGHVAPFFQKVIDPPDSEMVELSLKILRNMGALDQEERLTPLGFHLSQLPVDPRTGKMILMASLFGCIDPVFSIAACLSFNDPFVIPLEMEKDVFRIKKNFSLGETSDHLIYSETLKQFEETSSRDRGYFCDCNYLSYQTINLLSSVRHQFAKILHSMRFLASKNVKDPVNNINSDNRELVKAIVCAGLYPNVAILKTLKKGKVPTAILKTADHESVRFHVKSYCASISNFESPFFVYHHILKSSGIFIHDATMIHPMPLVFFGEKFDFHWDSDGYIIEVDDMIKFKSTNRTGPVIMKLRGHLNRILESAITNPAVFIRKKENAKILDAIIELLSSESAASFKLP